MDILSTRFEYAKAKVSSGRTDRSGFFEKETARGGLNPNQFIKLGLILTLGKREELEVDDSFSLRAIKRFMNRNVKV
jgi:hypothetical protein